MISVKISQYNRKAKSSTMAVLNVPTIKLGVGEDDDSYALSIYNSLYSTF